MTNQTRNIIGRIILALLLVLAAVLAVDRTRGGTPAIEAAGGGALPGSVASLDRVWLGDALQWVLIRGHDTNDPVLLFLHGGPGMPAMYLAHDFQRTLERDFVVVQWDRRGAGKSFDAGADSAALTVRRTLDETYELTRWLQARFDEERIYLVGHSWGSYLGMLAAWERPGMFAAFIGTGQMAADTARARALQREFVVSAARRSGDADVVRRVAETGEVRESDLFRYGGELRGATSFWPILRTGFLAPEYTLTDVRNVSRGAQRVARLMRHDVIDGPLDEDVLEVAVPVFFFLGRHDANTPSALAADYLLRLDAPMKGIVWFEESAHFPFWTEAERFHRELLRVRARVEEHWSGR